MSSQLHLEALAQSVGNVWALSPTFRAERSDTARHLSEFYMLEAEMGFVDDLGQVMDVVQALVADVAQSVLESKVGEELLAIALKAESTRIHDEKENERVMKMMKGAEKMERKKNKKKKKDKEKEKDRAKEKVAEDEVRSDGSESRALAIITAKTLIKRWRNLARGDFVRITYTKAIEELQTAAAESMVHFDHPVQWHAGLQVEHERALVDMVGRGGPVFVTHYPRAIKAFYMLPSHRRPGAHGPTVACFDLLLPDVCEVAGGSLREHGLAELLESMREHGLIKSKAGSAPESSSSADADADSTTGATPSSASVVVPPDDELGNLKWYVDLRRWGSVPHGGFGLGFDRLLAYLSGVSNIREVVTFPRWVGRCEC